MIPKDNKFYDFTRYLDRTPVSFRLGTVSMNGDSAEKAYFDTHQDAAHGWKNGAYHHLIDYIRVWDVPADKKIAEFPR